MALWTSSYPVDAGDRDPSFAWHDTDVPSAGLDDSQHDLFAQFLDFEAGHGSTSAAMGVGSVAAVAAEPFYMDQPPQQHHHHHAHHESSATSSGVSNADDFDFLSTSSNAAGYDVDPSALAMFAQDPAAAAMYAAGDAGVTVSDTELERLEDISLYSPKKSSAASADRTSPTPNGNKTLPVSNNNTTTAAPATVTNGGGTVNGRRSRKLVEALSSTIRKATTMRKTRKVSQALQRAVSPSLENPPMAIKPNTTQTLRGRRAHTQHALQQQQQQQQQHQFSESPPMLQVDTGIANGGGFVAGHFDDPFGGEISPTHAPPPQQQQQMRFYSQGAIGTPMDSPTRNAAMLQQQQGGQHWQQQQQQQQQQHNNNTQWSSAASSQHDLWWGGAGSGPGGIDAKNIDANMAMHSQHGELPYDVHNDGSMHHPNGGLMIHMPQPRPVGVNELALNAHTYLPPPVPPMPADSGARAGRPPKAPSSGARHNHHRALSSSPMRKQRAPSASPSPGTRQSRHSSGASAASSAQRSASGRVSVPGTPSGVKKRRSRDAGSGSFSADDGGGLIMLGGGGGGGGGFVNFTPNDGSVLMTGVAPSGSSKTKARREKEAQERRRRLSEAAMKAVAAAGGDIEKFREQGFAL